MREILAHVPFRGTIRERTTEPFVRLLKSLRYRRRVKGVLVDLSSGGGEAVASTDLYLALSRLDAVKPVIASIGPIGASGAYLAALGARRVFAYPESIVGSVGVVFPHVAVRELVRRLGISLELLHEGEHKDAFQGYRPLTEEERAKVQGFVREEYDRFVDVVAKRRHRTPEEMRELATGEFWTGAKALSLGLVDALGDREAALEELARLTGVPARRARTVVPPRPFFERLFSGAGGGFADRMALGLRETVEDVAFGAAGSSWLR